MKKKEVFAVIDCNNFFVSCERAFNPSLQKKPVLVLSNNDGCAISRSNEVKALGIEMAAPYYKIEEKVKEYNVEVFSSNFALYTDMSGRVMQTIASFAPDMEIYSIDEAFLSLTHLASDDYTSYCRELRETIMKWTGIPVAIGIAHTKTLSKIADKLSKKPEFNGVLDFTKLSEEEIDGYMKQLDVGSVWGIGRKMRKKLNNIGITTIYEFKYAKKEKLKQVMNVVGIRTYMEIQGKSCLAIESVRDLQKGISCTRSFGHYVETQDELNESVSMYTANACEKLRKQKALASYITVFIHTNKHNKFHKQYFNAVTLPIPDPSSYTPILTHAALEALDKIYKPGYKYNKAGVILGGIVRKKDTSANLFDISTEEGNAQSAELMKAIDKLNTKYGKHTVHLASEGTSYKWHMKQNKVSPRYTTSWQELLTIIN